MEALPGFAQLPEVDDVVWGIDPSSRRAALAVLEPGNRLAGGPKLHVRSTPLSQAPSRSTRFDEAYGQHVELFEAWTNAGYLPSCVYIEIPFIPRQHRNDVTHLFMYGVTLAAIGKACGDVQIVEVPPQTWKSKALGAGRGRAEKSEILRWAQSLGYEGSIQDEADAVGVCIGGAVMRRLALAAA